MIEVFCTGNQDYFDARQLPAHFFTPCRFVRVSSPRHLDLRDGCHAVLCLQRRQKASIPRYVICTTVVKPEAKDA